jgi:hypothetical protein
MLLLTSPLNCYFFFLADDFVYLHFGHGNEIHLTGKFLPFHRHYLHGLQNVMKERCGYPYPLPYWCILVTYK